MINQINSWMVKNFKYKIVNNKPICDSFFDKKGQCYQITYIFKDLCEAVGIKCEYVENSERSHCWNKITINDKSGKKHEYYFDVTDNIQLKEKGKNDNSKYSWLEDYDGKIELN